MAVLGTERAGKTWAIMDTDVDGQGWAVDLMLVLQNGKKCGGRKATGVVTKS